jgi:predicted  nucleic acid-binding Zn-ribbon protein
MTAVLEPLHQSVAEFQTGCGELEELLDEMFQEMDRLRIDLLNRMGTLDQQQAKLDDQGEQLEQQRGEIDSLKSQLKERDSQLADVQQELEQTQSEFRNQLSQNEDSASTAQQQLQEELGKSQTQCESLSQQIGELQTEVDRLQAAENELTEARAELQAQAVSSEQAASTAREQLQQQLDASQQHCESLEQQLAQTRSEMARFADMEVELAETRRQLLNAQQPGSQSDEIGGNSEDANRLAALTQERDALEEELELVRGRASELTETVAAQEQQLHEKQKGSTDELQQLRRLVEKQAELIAERAAPPAEQPTRERNSDTKQAADDDAVVSSVMAQFAKLQKNVSQRRKQK